MVSWRRHMICWWRWSASSCDIASKPSLGLRRGGGKGLGNLRGKRGMKSEQEIADRHDLQTPRNRRISMRLSRPLAIGSNSSSGSSEHSKLSLMSCVSWLTWLLHNDNYYSSWLEFCGEYRKNTDIGFFLENNNKTQTISLVRKRFKLFWFLAIQVKRARFLVFTAVGSLKNRRQKSSPLDLFFCGQAQFFS